MLTVLPPFFDHSRHKLVVHSLPIALDVLAFEGEEQLSRPFLYRVEFTSVEQDIGAERMLGKTAQFSLHAAAHTLPVAIRGLPVPRVEAFRTLHGVVTGFKRLSGSADEARYEITLQPRLALLGRGRQFRIYQHQSVPQIVESILRTRHDFEGQDFLFTLVREYPKREQVMQYGESDLSFIARLLAEVGIWYRFTNDERLGIAVVEFHDDQRHYVRPRISLPFRPQSGLGSSGADGVWGLQVSHEVVEKNVHFRAYHHRDANAWLDGDVDQTRGDTTTYGEAYRYAEPYRVLGDKLDQDEDLEGESGFFYARLRHEKYLNNQTRLTGISSSASLGLAQVLAISGDAPRAFEPGAVITRLRLHAARDRSFELSFAAIPYSESVCFRPPLQAKPKIAGTVPARVTSSLANDPYSHIDSEGRYKVSFLFDRDSWKLGEESLWLRLARPYAGDTHGLHLPLICGTEVAIAFEQGDPDRPYIAHALHDNRHPDHVTLLRSDYKRNVLRTPANNKLRMEDDRGKEHIKLSTEHSGKSQLNLGHLVDNEKDKRGEGFELRTDSWGAIRAGNGLLISADEQTRAHGMQLDMDAAIDQLETALSLARTMAQAAKGAGAIPADTSSHTQLNNALTHLTEPGLLLHAPAGIGIVTPEAICLSSGRESVAITSSRSTDISAGRNMTGTAEGAISLCAVTKGLQIKAVQGDVQLHAQSAALHALAQHDIKIESLAGRIEISAPKELVLSCGGAFIRIKDGEIELGAPGNIYHRAAYVLKAGATMLTTPVTPIPYGYGAGYTLVDAQQAAARFVRYRITTQNGEVFNGVTDKDGKTMPVHTMLPGHVAIDFPQSEERLKPRPTPELEEEEEEEEITEGITLRIGLFFDGTGNNQSNAAATAQCRQSDLDSFSREELESIAATCKQYGFGEFDGSAFNSAPNNSYGNAPSNVAYLYDLYPDNSTTPVKTDQTSAYISAYIEGIGTRSGGEDDMLVGQALGQGETGVVARVLQAPTLAAKELERFRQKNPGIYIQQIEFDIFGFSRGAAAARHCANELLKPARGIFEDMLKVGGFGLLKSFDAASDVSINLIGLFDTVAAISDPLHGDFSPGDDVNRCVNLYLPPDCARQVIQLQALHEYRADFSLNNVHHTHLQIGLPGAHSDVGGGYLPRAREKLWMTQPSKASVPTGQRVESHAAWACAEADAKVLRESGVARDGYVAVKAWPAATNPRGKVEPVTQDYWITVLLERPVHGELSLIALRVMRELGIRHGVPFKGLEERPELAIPDELVPIAKRILQRVMTDRLVRLEPAQEALLRARYIHLSAHWTPRGLFLLSKPAPLNRRNVHLNRPQEGYPE
ncbi:type VI secretion system tip protein VgrG [Pseudomonas graminis]|uniref:Type VI secretion system secreted protein VgrG n=1 Tax=Pseudomonas graminis TaxID=158627 RepID=A0A1I0DDW4_9PSED|nr:type VI secretion system secreted protein VgrG [Pseudomonas graminis]